MDPRQLAAMSLSAQMPGGFSPVGVDRNAMAQYKADADAARAVATQAQETIKLQGENQTEALRQATEFQMKAQEEASNLARLASEAKQTSINEARRYQAAQMSVMEQARRAAAEPTDPNRYWNNKSAGQQAAAVIAGALFGFTGQGMQWLNRIDTLVEQDMNAQRADRASKVAGLERQGAALGQAGQQALQLGATEAEAHLIERQARLEGLKSYLDLTGMKLQNAQQQMQAQQMSAALGQHIAGLSAQGVGLAQQQADSINQARYQNAQLQQQKYAMAMKSLQGGDDGLEKRTPGLIEREAAARAAWDALPDLEKAIGSGKLGDALLDEMAKHIPGTDSANRDQQAKLIGRIIFAGIDKSVVNAADQEFLNKLQSGVGLRSMSRGDIPAFRRLIKSSFDAANATAAGGGMRSTLPLSPVTSARAIPERPVN